jgi:hypothetical protein
MNNIPIYIINCNNESRKKRMIDRFKHVNLIPIFNCFTDISGIWTVLKNFMNPISL